jgi:hypothetical protein
VRQAAGNALQRLTLTQGQVALDEQIPMREQVGDLGWQALSLTDERAVLLRRPAAFEFGWAGGQAFAHTGHGMQHSLAHISQHMPAPVAQAQVKLADLVRDLSDDFRDGAGIQGRAVCGDRVHGQTARVQVSPKRTKKGGDIDLGEIMIKPLVEQPLEGAVVHNGQNAERPVIEFIRRQITGDAERARAQFR